MKLSHKKPNILIFLMIRTLLIFSISASFLPLRASRVATDSRLWFSSSVCREFIYITKQDLYRNVQNVIMLSRTFLSKIISSSFRRELIYINQAKPCAAEVMLSLPSVCLFVSLLVNSITQKLIDSFSSNFRTLFTYA